MAGYMPTPGGTQAGQSGGTIVPTLKQQQLPGPTLQGVKGGTVFEVVRITSANNLTPTQQKEYLVALLLEGGATPGAFELLYDGVHQAIFPCPASGLDATGAIGPEETTFYPINYGPIGTNIPSTIQTFGGGLAAVKAVFSNKPNPMGRKLSEFRGVFVTGNEAATSGTAKTYSIPGPLAQPKGITALAGINSGTATGFPVAEIDFPAIGNYAAYTVPAILSRGKRPRSWSVPDYDPASSFSLTHKALSLGGATTIAIAGTLWY